MTDLPPLSWGVFMRTWDIHLASSSVCAALLAVYLGCVVGRHRAIQHPRWRTASFTIGVMVLWLALSSGIAVYGRELFWLHMVLHLTLIMVVPALLVLGSPLGVAHRVGDARWRHRTASVLESGPASALLHPLTGLAAYTAVIVGTHLTSFMDRMAAHGWLEPTEVVLYVLAGWLLLTPVLGEEPIPRRPAPLARIGLLVVAMVPDTVVGIVLLQTTVNPFPMMFPGVAWGPDPLSDVHVGGAVMWVGGDGLMMVFAVGVMVAMLAGQRNGSVLGSWLESARRSTLADLTGEAEIDDVDNSDSALAAYNRMLQERHGQR
jgi:cytochrome c oxidase assembly factor CtaG